MVAKYSTILNMGRIKQSDTLNPSLIFDFESDRNKNPDKRITTVLMIRLKTSKALMIRPNNIFKTARIAVIDIIAFFIMRYLGDGWNGWCG